MNYFFSSKVEGCTAKRVTVFEENVKIQPQTSFDLKDLNNSSAHYFEKSYKLMYLSQQLI